VTTPHPTSGQHISAALSDTAAARYVAAHLLRGCCSQHAAAEIDALAAAAIAELTEFRVQIRAELAALDAFTLITPAHFGGHRG
jgi:hypothetical protein